MFSAPRAIYKLYVNGKEVADASRQGNMKLAACAGSGGWTAPTPGSAAAKTLPLNQL